MLTHTSKIYGASWIHLPHIPLRAAIACQRYTEQTPCSCSNRQIRRTAALLLTLPSSSRNTVCLLYCSCARGHQHFRDFYVHLRVSFPGSTLWNLTRYIWWFKLSVRLSHLPPPPIYSFLTDCVLQFISRNLNGLNLLYLIVVREASWFVVPFHWFLTLKSLLCIALSEAITVHE